VSRRPLRDLYGLVWCTTCETEHIPEIPTVTLLCADCGFGVWPDHTAVAVDHAIDYPEHNVYARHHQTVEEAPVVRVATDYRCPTCGAHPGDNCVDVEDFTREDPAVAPHPAREELAKVRETDG